MTTDSMEQRQAEAQRVAAAFNTFHAYLGRLAPADADHSLQLEQAHIRLDESAMWAIKSVLAYGTKPAAGPEGDGEPPAAPIVGNDANGSPTTEVF
jgi:hypothetical protein